MKRIKKILIIIGVGLIFWSGVEVGMIIESWSSEDELIEKLIDREVD